ncbi:MAG: hypothetical protein AAF226_06095 [Verrucomicrobiota bacterium]
MARRKDSGMSVNLFPFLSILVSIIGCLTMIIVVINVSLMNKVDEGQTPEESLRIDAYVKLKKEKEADQKEMDKLRMQLEKFIQDNQADLAVMDKLTALRALVEDKDKTEADLNELIAQFNAIKNTIERLDAEHPPQLEEIKRLQADVDKLDAPPEPQALRVRPSGSGGNEWPIFVEAANGAIKVHRSLSETPKSITLESIKTSEEFIDALKAASKPGTRMIFLVRGNRASANAYRRASKEIDNYNSENKTKIVAGRLPLPAEGKIDLTPFAKFLKK